MPSKLVTKKLNFSVGTLGAGAPAPAASAAGARPPLPAAGAPLPAAELDAAVGGFTGAVAAPLEPAAGLPDPAAALTAALPAVEAWLLLAAGGCVAVVVLGAVMVALVPEEPLCVGSGSWLESLAALPPQAAAHNTTPTTYKLLKALIDNLARQFS